MRRDRAKHSRPLRCGPAFGVAASCRAVVADYRAAYKARACDELEHFRNQSSLAGTIQEAGLARGADGKRLPHQYRIPAAVLRESEELLQRGVRRIARATSFAALHRIIATTVGDIAGIGELYLYDTSLRIGAKLGLEPKEVFVHAGTREGARALGLEHRRHISMSDLPAAFRALQPHEVEDVLCIYKSQLNRLRSNV